jgi:hypothetical protein
VPWPRRSDFFDKDGDLRSVTSGARLIMTRLHIADEDMPRHTFYLTRIGAGEGRPVSDEETTSDSRSAVAVTIAEGGRGDRGGIGGGGGENDECVCPRSRSSASELMRIPTCSARLLISKTTRTIRSSINSPARGIREAYGSSVSRLSNGTGLPVPADLRRSAYAPAGMPTYSQHDETFWSVNSLAGAGGVRTASRVLGVASE